MSGPQRTTQGGNAIDRSRPQAFSFDGEALQGYAGDTLASALLANGVRLVGRSFKYHRPRGIVSAGSEEPNAVLDLRHGERHDPNARATLEWLADGMQLRSIHANGTPQRDRLSYLDRLARFIPAAFYYKTFMWPRWMWYEHAIRNLAGLGRLDPTARAPVVPRSHLQTDLCVVGAGPAGIAAAQAAARRGARVLLIDARTAIGGSLLYRAAQIEGLAAPQWLAEVTRTLPALGVDVRLRTMALGLYDHNRLLLLQRCDPTAADRVGEHLLEVRAGRIVLATGAVERPLLFAGNDRPGVMLADAALEYLGRYGVRCGSRAVIATGNDSAYALAHALREAGADCTVVDSRATSAEADCARGAGIDVRLDTRVVGSTGALHVTGARLDSGVTLEADLLAVAGGWTPLIHLYCHSRGKPRWNDHIGALVPDREVDGLHVVGAANGALGLAQAWQQGSLAGGGSGEAPQLTGSVGDFWGGAPDLTHAGSAGRVWVDLQNDVTSKDVELAVRENFAAVEHLKRYTTLGMATDQGKTSNVNGLALLAAGTGRDIGAVGVTTFRPPFVPVSMAAVAGRELGELQSPVRRLPAEDEHRKERAYFRDYGNLLRPAWYGPDEAVIAAECRAARESAVVLDASPLGKIDVIGPQAAALLDFIFYTRMSTLAPGRLRYGLALAESGAIWDDGVVLRLAPEHFVVSCSSSHVAAMTAHLDEWREDHFDLRQVFVHDTTAHWATMAVSGPQARNVLAALELGFDPDDAQLPHMSATQGRFMGGPARIARVSFTGERSYEISVPAGLAGTLWRRIREAGALPLGVEALGVLRAEKGFIFVGQDTDSETMPQDIGMDGPRLKRSDAYVGDRSLFMPAASKAGRRQLVGIAAATVHPLPVGAHAVTTRDSRMRSIGFITSSYRSVALQRPIALALIEDGMRRMGDELEFEHLGSRLRGTVVPACQLDPTGARLNA